MTAPGPFERLKLSLRFGLSRYFGRAGTAPRRLALRTRAWSPRRLRGAALILALLFLTWPLASWYLLFHSPLAGDFYPGWHAKRVVPVVRDAAGELVGLWPRAGADVPYLAAAPARLPSHWWHMLVLLEDANRHRWYHLFGIDWSQIPKWFVRALLGRPNAGGSTLEMQLAKTLHADTDASGLFRVLRKLRDFAVAPAFALQLGREADLTRWTAAHFPMLRSGPHGLETAAWLLFGRPAARLGLAEQALLAAAVKYRIDTNAVDDAGWERARARWERTRARAAFALRMLHRTGAIDAPVLARALGRLETLALPTLTPGPAVRACLEERDRHSLDLAARKLDVRAKFLARSELRQADAELRAWMGERWTTRVSVVRLSIRAGDNCRAKWMIERLRPEADTGNGYRLVAVADERGRLIRFYSSSSLPVFVPFRYRAGNPAFVLTGPEQDERTIGSLGKVFAALLAGAAGDGPDSRYLRLRRERLVGRYPYQRRVPFRNADGFTGTADADDPRAPVTARLAFARSDNLAIMERLARLGNAAGRAVPMIEAFGLAPGPRFEPVVDVPLGRIHGAPREIMGLFALLASDDPAPVACRPAIVEEVEPRPGAAGPVRHARDRYRTRTARQCRTARAWLADGDALAFTRRMLAGVLDPKAGGTAARHMADFREGGPYHPALSIAKTGTVRAAAGRPDIRWAWLAGAVRRRDGRTYAYVAHVGPAGRAVDLGTETSGGTLGRLVAPLLRPLMETDTEDRP